MTEDHLALIFREWLGVPPSAGRVLAALYLAEGRVVRHADLGAAARQTGNGLALSIKHLRRAMEREAIVCVWGTGYRLGAPGVADCENALADARQRRAA